MYNPQLETFIRVADAGSFTKAAAKAYITPTAVIKQINLLEADLGLPLFHRSHRGLTLTESGKSLYRDALYIIQYSKESIARARFAMEGTENIIRIGTSPMTPGQFLVELWPKIHEHCPDIKFQLVPYENTPENAREILKNLGRNIDIVAGIYDDSFLSASHCAALELTREPLRCAVSIHHRLSSKTQLNVQDLYGENLMLIEQGWNHDVDMLRNDIRQHHNQIKLLDFSFFNLSVFNRCENSNDILMAIDSWINVHPLLKIIPINWNYSVSYGLLHAPIPSPTVSKFLNAVQMVLQL